MGFEKLKKEKQHQILNAAYEVFARHGYRKASMQDIAEAAGVSKSVLFKYFATKQNLYTRLFRMAAESIGEADAKARAEAGSGVGWFALMRRTAKTRLGLFTTHPWMYRFAYTAAFDADPFVRELMQKELEEFRKANRDPGTQGSHGDLGFRKDIPSERARQIIFWVSQGFLEERLYQGEIHPERLEADFEEWVDVLETVLGENARGEE